jgi:hypothetical protein
MLSYCYLAIDIDQFRRPYHLLLEYLLAIAVIPLPNLM